MTIDSSEIKEALHQAVLEAYCADYKELSDIWKGLEVKAQGTVTIAGIFIAATFAFIRDLNNLHWGYPKRLLLGLAIFSLVFCVILAILVLTLRTVEAPPTGEYVGQIVKDILRLKFEETVEDNAAKLSERKILFINEQIREWHKAKESASKILKRKVRYLWVAQWLLVTAISLVVLLTLSIIFG